MCFWRCGGIAHVRDGKLWKFEGNPLDPQSHGRLCPRGTGAVGAHYDPDRLRQPLIRVGERGKEQWKAVTWDEALTLIADAHGQDQGRARPGIDRAVQPRPGPAFHPACAEELGRHQLRRAVLRAMPRRARCRLSADLRQRRRLARAHRHREHRLPGADRLAPGREHAQLAGAGVRQGDRAARAGDRRRSALLGGREQGQVLAADQARHRPGAAAGLDEPAGRRRPLRQGLRGAPRPRFREHSRPTSRATRPNGPPRKPGFRRS